MQKIDLVTNFKQINESWDNLIKDKLQVRYVIYSVGTDSVVSLYKIGTEGLSEFLEEFSDGVVQIGIVKIKLEESNVDKIVLVGWCPDNVSIKSRTSFASNFFEFSRVFSGYHIQVICRDFDDLNINEFMKKVLDMGGIKNSKDEMKNHKKKNQTNTNNSNLVSKKTNESHIKPKPNVINKFLEKKKSRITTNKKETELNKINDKKNNKKTHDLEIESTSYFNDNNDTDIADNFNDIPKTLSDKLKIYRDIESSSLPIKPKLRIENNQFKINDKLNTMRNKNYIISNHNNKKLSLTTIPDHGSNDNNSLSEILIKKKQNLKSFSDQKKGDIYSNNDNEALNLKNISKKTPTKMNNNHFVEKDKPHKVNKLDSLMQNFESKTIMMNSTNTSFLKTYGNDSTQISKVKVSGFKMFEQKKNQIQKSLNLSFDNLNINVVSPIKNNDGNNSIISNQKSVNAVSHDDFSNILNSTVYVESCKSSPHSNNSESESFKKTNNFDETERNILCADKIEKIDNSDFDQDNNSILSFEKNEATDDSFSKNKLSVVANYSYEKDEINELSFKTGDQIVDVEKVDENWWNGFNLRTGESGLFPSTYVSVNDVDLNVSLSSKKIEYQSNFSKPSAIAQCDYERDEENELSFTQNDLIVDISFVDDNWWCGKNSETGNVGLFPSNYVKLNES